MIVYGGWELKNADDGYSAQKLRTSSYMEPNSCCILYILGIYVYGVTTNSNPSHPLNIFIPDPTTENDRGELCGRCHYCTVNMGRYVYVHACTSTKGQPMWGVSRYSGVYHTE